MTAGAAVLFDFDGTLVRGDCAAAWLRTRLTDSTWRKLVAGVTWPFLRPGFAWWRSAWLPASFYTWLATVGRTPESLEEARDDFLQDCARRRDALLIAPAVARLQAHLAAGDRVVIVTGAETALARGLWRALGGPDVELIGSTVRPAFGGYVGVEHTIGPRKLAALAEGRQPGNHIDPARLRLEVWNRWLAHDPVVKLEKQHAIASRRTSMTLAFGKMRWMRPTYRQLAGILSVKCGRLECRFERDV